MKPLVWGHRGASAYAPENTIESFVMACEMGADGIELDVHLSADGRLMVSHDDKIDRCSDGTGSIAAMTFDELRSYNFGARFSDKYPGKFFAIPTLGEVYDAVKPYGITVNAELKTSGRRYLDLVLETEDERGMNGKIVYSSFDHFNLSELLERRPDAFVAPLYSNNMVKPWSYAASMGAKALHPQLGQLDRIKSYCEKAHELGVRVHPWTVDSEDDLRRMYDYGVDAVITNRPDIAIALRDAK